MVKTNVYDQSERKYILTEQECLDHNGHEYGQVANVTGSPQPQRYTRTCIYCGHTQRGYQPYIVWSD